MQARFILCKAAVQLVLLYRTESWVVTDEMLKVIEGFHHHLARKITGMTAHRTTGGEWE